MKKILTTIAICAFAIGISAQETQATTKGSTIVQGKEFGFMYTRETKTYAISYSKDFRDYLKYEIGLESNLEFGDEKTNAHAGYISLGAQRKYLYDNNFLISLFLGPYAGVTYQSYITPETTEDYIYRWKDRFGNVHVEKRTRTTGGEEESKIDFTYGIWADVSLGVRIHKNCFFNIGYRIAAPEFETEDMFKNGQIKLSITTLF